MAGPAKHRAQKEKQQQQQQARSSDNSSASHGPTQRSINKFDGNKDPHGHGQGVTDYTRPNDLKNLSEFLGMSGWCAARGVSTNTPLSHTFNISFAMYHVDCTTSVYAPVSIRLDAVHIDPCLHPLPCPSCLLHILWPRKISHTYSFP